MSDKYVVPEGMLKACSGGMGLLAQDRLEIVLEAALRWLDVELEKRVKGDPYINDTYYRTETLNENSVRTGYNKAIAEVRRMFLAPNPEVPEEIKDLLCEEVPHTGPYADVHNAQIIESFRRGQKSRETEK